ncbi:MAG: Gfo/Idh/MocA family oxidoreductase [Nitrospinae bacterium]|nr:Gfo/Idh/MocA family oxidoreductase [Nitrospinota bacterium]
MSARAYRVGIIGLGRIASLLEDDPLRGKPATLAGAFAAHPKARIVAGCDINTERRGLFARRWGVKKLYADFHDMLARERLDIVAVASWTETHAEAVIAAARAGARGIYCEKPIAINLAQARRMIAACRRSGAAMVVGHERRWARPYRAILGNHTAELYETRPSGRYSGFMELARVPFPQWDGEANPYVGAVDGLIRAMETGEPPLSSGEDGLMALETIMAMYRSAAKGGAPVRIAPASPRY